MCGARDAHSYLVKLRVCNIGCIGPDGLEVCLDEIVCLVGANNTGKSTVLRAYEAAVTGAILAPDEISLNAGGQPATVELWVHIPAEAENIDAKWKEHRDGMLLVRSKWTWTAPGGKPVRTTFDPQTGDYAEDGKASGLDNVFNSRLPRPFRIGSLDDPSGEHKKLLELVLEPIQTRFAALMKEEGSDLRKRISDLYEEAEKPVAAFKAVLEEVQARVNSSYRRVFSASEIRLSVSLGELSLDLGAALVRASHIGVRELRGETRWSQQGTGSQRALFWSMLEVRSELNRIADERKQKEKLARDCERELGKLKAKAGSIIKSDALAEYKGKIKALEENIGALRSHGSLSASQTSRPFLPGYMLLIDEPETALHPTAIRAAKEHLYSLAAQSGWQVMLSTHHPAFIDPLKDHTTIVRLHRPESKAAPNVYRADTAKFDTTEMEILKALLAFDQSVGEMFFADKVIIVEGDTEFAAFTVVMDADSQSFPVDGRPLILRARGKWTIPLLIRMLAHFKVPCAVLHDVDSPRVGPSGKRNGAYSANQEISNAVEAARNSGVHVIHRCSEPDFERKHGMSLPSKDKPFNAWCSTRENATIHASVRKSLDELCKIPTSEAVDHNDDGRHFDEKCKTWARANAGNDPAFDFD